MNRTESISDEALKALSGKVVFFGHQSVGLNILEGVEQHYSEFVDVQGISGKMSSEDQLLIHQQIIGRNLFPLSKLEGFEELF